MRRIARTPARSLNLPNAGGFGDRFRLGARMERLYGTLEIRAVDDERRIVEGVASTNALDDYETILEPKGARFSLPLPLLWQHRGDTPVGEVISAEVTDTQIKVRAKLARIA